MAIGCGVLGSEMLPRDFPRLYCNMYFSDIFKCISLILLLAFPFQWQLVADCWAAKSPLGTPDLPRISTALLHCKMYFLDIFTCISFFLSDYVICISIAVCLFVAWVARVDPNGAKQMTKTNVRNEHFAKRCRSHRLCTFLHKLMPGRTLDQILRNWCCNWSENRISKTLGEKYSAAGHQAEYYFVVKQLSSFF